MRINLLLLAVGGLAFVAALVLAPLVTLLAAAGLGAGAFGLLRDDGKPTK